MQHLISGAVNQSCNKSYPDHLKAHHPRPIKMKFSSLPLCFILSPNEYLKVLAGSGSEHDTDLVSNV